MNILVTGGAGYVGSTLVPLLLGVGHHVRVLDALHHGGAPLLGVWNHPRFQFMAGDLRSVATVEAAVSGMEAVVHLAAIVGDPACARDPVLARAVNLEASHALIAASRSAGVRRFVFASTCSNYGKMENPETYVDEESELRPVSLYAETKVAIERTLLNGGSDDGWCPTPLRFSTVYGVSPRMRFDLTVNEFTAALIRGRKLTVFGERFWRPYIHVLDAARAIQRVLDAQRSEVRCRVFNVGSSDQNYQKQQLVELIRKHAPTADVEYVHKQEDPRDYRVSFRRIRSELDFSLTRTVEDGIEEVARLVANGVIADPDAPAFRN
jgi:nucleoside-diphosphate-sugar epimerase